MLNVLDSAYKALLVSDSAVLAAEWPLGHRDPSRSTDGPQWSESTLVHFVERLAGD